MIHLNSGRLHAIAPIRRTEEQRFGPHPVEWLPHVTCIAEFHDSQPARDPNAECSSLLVVWFQPDFGQPPEGPILQELRAIDWDSLATDGWY